jgi:hypothetical protein
MKSLLGTTIKNHQRGLGYFTPISRTAAILVLSRQGSEKYHIAFDRMKVTE